MELVRLWRDTPVRMRSESNGLTHGSFCMSRQEPWYARTARPGVDAARTMRWWVRQPLVIRIGFGLRNYCAIVVRLMLASNSLTHGSFCMSHVEPWYAMKVGCSGESLPGAECCE